MILHKASTKNNNILSVEAEFVPKGKSVRYTVQGVGVKTTEAIEGNDYKWFTLRHKAKAWLISEREAEIRSLERQIENKKKQIKAIENN